MAPQQTLIASVFCTSDEDSNPERKALGAAVGTLLASSGFSVAAGFARGITADVFGGALSVGGRTISVLEVSESQADSLLAVEDTRFAHGVLARAQMLYDLASICVGLTPSLESLFGATYAWHLNLLSRTEKPLILVGPEWAELLPALVKHLDITPDQFAYISLARDVKTLNFYIHNWLGVQE